jgi:serine/threonine-protein kinase
VGYFSWQGTGLDGDCVLYKVPTGGGTPIALATVASVPYGAVWRGNDILVAVNTARFAGIQAVPAKGGSPRTLISVDPQKEFVAQPDLLDDGDQLVYVVRPARLTGSQGAQIVIQSLSSGGRSVLANGTSPHVVSAGALVFRDGAALLAAPFNARTRVIGAPVQMIDGVSTANLTLSTLFAVSRTGTLVFVPSNLAARTLFVSVDRQGRETPIAAEPRAYRFPRISPDGTTIAVDAADQEHDIWVLNLRQESLRRFTFGPDTETGPLWDADGRAIIYSSVDKVFRKPLDGTRPADLIGTLLPGLRLTSVSPDGRWLFWRSANVAADAMFAFPLDHSGPSKQLLPQADYLQWDGEISPDGHWIAYASNESGTFEVYVRPFPDVDAGHWRVSTDGGQTPMWSRSGKELFFMATTARSPLMGVAVHTEKFFEFEKPRKLFDMDPYLRPGYQRAFDVFPDDQRFLLLKSSEDAASQAPRMVVVTNWFDELRARMQPGR